MEISCVADLRPRFVWDILDDAFDLYREHFATICAISAVVFVPCYVLYMAGTAALAHSFFAGDTSNDASNILGADFIAVLLGFPLLLIARTLQSGPLAAAVRIVLEGRAPTLRQAYAESGRRMGALLFSGLLVAVLAVGGFCVAGLGQVVVMIYAAFIGPSLVLEKRRVGSAIQRSIDLASSDAMRVLGIVLLASFVSWVFSVGLGGIADLAYSLIPTNGEGSAIVQETRQFMIHQATGGLSFFIAEPLIGIAASLLYFDLRVRREGIDLAGAARDKNVALAEDPFGDLPSARVISQQNRRRR